MNIEWWCGLASGLCGVGMVCLLLLLVDLATENKQ